MKPVMERFRLKGIRCLILLIAVSRRVLAQIVQEAVQLLDHWGSQKSRS